MEKSLSLSEANYKVEAVIRSAKTGDRMKRSILASLVKREKLTDPGDQLAALLAFPRCLGCSTSGKITIYPLDASSTEEPTVIPFDEVTVHHFLDLPDQITEKWLDEVLTLNPHWATKDLGSTEDNSKKG